MTNNGTAKADHHGYMTVQKRSIISFLSKHADRHFTAEEICLAVNTPKVSTYDEAPSGKKTGLSTIYRQLGNLYDDGIIQRYPADNGGFVYQYSNSGNCNHHFHLRCVNCGKVIHLDCPISNDLLEHITKSHGFIVDSGKSVLYGMCEDCNRHKENTLC